ncbi:MAG: hypothetical protein L0Y35_00835 [Flammeovirgaceae bacterium]|nr:hypothetical protein [Flammeovirgaceae bacterium]
MTTTVISKSRKLVVLIVVIIIGVFFNAFTSEAKTNPAKKANKVYNNACAKLSKKHSQTENYKVSISKRPSWR